MTDLLDRDAPATTTRSRTPLLLGGLVVLALLAGGIWWFFFRDLRAHPTDRARLDPCRGRDDLGHRRRR